MRFVYTDRFRKAFSELEAGDVELVQKALRLLAEDLRHPSLLVKKMQGTDHIWEARASRSLRLTFELREGGLLLRNVGPHDVIPKTIREQLGLSPGQKIQAIALGDRVELIPVRKASELRGFLAGIETTVEREEDRE